MNSILIKNKLKPYLKFHHNLGIKQAMLHICAFQFPEIVAPTARRHTHMQTHTSGSKIKDDEMHISSCTY